MDRHDRAEPGAENTPQSESHHEAGRRDMDIRNDRASSLFISFLIVAGGYVVLYVLLHVAYYILVLLLAPETAEALKLERGEFRQLAEINPNLLWPHDVVNGFLAVAGLLACLLGLVTAKLARFSKFAHGAMLALVTFVTLLQMGLTNQTVPQWVKFGWLLVIPPGILLGSWLGSRWRRRSQKT